MRKRKTDEWSRLLVETMPQGLGVLDRYGSLVYVNAALCRTLQYEENELLGHPVTDFVVEADHSTLRERLAGPGCNDHSTIDVAWVAKPGQLVFTFASCQWIYRNGDVLGNLLVVTNITRRKEAEDALRVSESKYRMLMESAPIGIYIQQDGKIVYANNRFADIFGYSRDELIGSDLRRLFYPGEERLLDASTTGSVTDEQSLSSYTTRGVTKFGQCIWIKENANVTDFESKPALLGSVADVTQEKLLEQTLRNSQQEQKHLSDQLLYTQERERKRLSVELHDGIGQYLSAIKFSLESLRGSAAVRSSESVLRSVESVSVWTETAISEVRKITMDLRPAMLDDIGVIATITWFCRQFQALYSTIGLEKQIDVREDDIPKRLKIVIYRVVQEALNNIAKHARATAAWIILRRTVNSIDLILEDNGIGFNPEEALHTACARGSIGIISLKERTELSGGYFVVRSRPGGSTSVRAIWPC